MSKCLYKQKDNDLELLYNDIKDKKDNYIIDVKKIDKLGDLFTIKTFDAELNKSVPITVDDKGAITSINHSQGIYYNSEPPKIIIRPPASPDGKPAIAKANMVSEVPAVTAGTAGTVWKIGSITIEAGGSGYDAITDKDKIEIEKKNTAQKKIVYNENKPKYYLLEQKASQCNNLTDRWHNWFSIPYYYLGNNDGRRKIDEDDKTRNVFKCYNKCEDKYVVNKDNVCESIQTFEGGKYRNYIPYDPLAIICILGSYQETYTPASNIIKPNGVDGNYYYTIQNIKAGIDEDINTSIKTKILSSLGNITDNNHPVDVIRKDIAAAYSVIENYIRGIIVEAEKNDLKIKTIIKNNINDFYQLFDKRDVLYISYLNKLIDSKHFKRILYAKSIAHTQADTLHTNTKNDIQKYLNYLFKYCKFLYFNKNNLFAIRLLNYGIYNDGYIIDDINNPDEGVDNAIVFSSEPVKINYNPVAVKIDTKHKNIFDDYSNAYELYKSFILTYPIILLLSVGLFIIIIVLYWFNAIYLAASFLNSVYIFIIGAFYSFAVLLACNSLVIKMVVFIISTAYQAANFIYSFIMGFFGLTIVRIILFLMLITALMSNNFGFIYGIVMYFVNTIIYFIFGIISIFIYLLRGIIFGNPDVIVPLIFILPILYVYYKIWFNFDINTLDKDIKKGATIINEHSNITTILKSSSGTSISNARLELYKHSYFMNLYEKAYENYVEKIEEIEKYNKNLLIKLDNTAKTPEEEAEAKAEQEAIKNNLDNKNKEFKGKIENADIAREQRRSAEKELMDYDVKTDKNLRASNKELYKNPFNQKGLKELKENRNTILNEKGALKANLRKLKTEENKERGALGDKIPNISGIPDIKGLTGALGDKIPKLPDIKGLTGALGSKIPNISGIPDIKGLTGALGDKIPKLPDIDILKNSGKDMAGSILDKIKV